MSQPDAFRGIVADTSDLMTDSQIALPSTWLALVTALATNLGAKPGGSPPSRHMVERLPLHITKLRRDMWSSTPARASLDTNVSSDAQKEQVCNPLHWNKSAPHSPR